MAKDVMHYDEMVTDALRGVVRDTLAATAAEGLKGGHHFYITFSTNYPGVELPDRVKQRYPEDITITLQHQFWDLKVGNDNFSVLLSFDRAAEKVCVPLKAISAFSDPSVEFSLVFSPEPEKTPPNVPPPPRPTHGTNVVQIDHFRKKT